MIFGVLIGIVLRLANFLFSMVPQLGDVVGQLGSALSFFIQQSIPWNFLFPLTDAMDLVVLLIKFEMAMMIFFFARWIAEMVRGK